MQGHGLFRPVGQLGQFWAITFLSYMIKGHNSFQWCFLTFSTLITIITRERCRKKVNINPRERGTVYDFHDPRLGKEMESVSPIIYAVCFRRRA